MVESSRRRGMPPILAFFLGFLFALIIIAGAIAGAVAYVLNYKLDNIQANKDSEGNYLFINANPADGGVGTVLDLIKTLSSMSKDYGNMTVGEVEELIPVMSKLTEKLESELNNYLTLEEGELQAVKLGGLGEFVGSLADRINVAKLIGTDTSNAILVYISYGVHGLKEEDGVWKAKYTDEYAENGEDATVYDCTLVIKGDGKIDGAYYEKDGEEVFTPYLTLENVKSRVAGVCEELTIGEIVPISEGDRILGSIKNSTVNSISKDINNLCIQQIFADEVYAPRTAEDGSFDEAQIYLAVAIADETPAQATTYGDENTIYYELDGSDYVLAGNNGKLTQDEFDNASSTLYTLGDGKILYDESYLYYEKDEAGDYLMINAGETDAGRAGVPAAGDEIYTYGAASPLWKLLLIVDKEEQAYTFNNIGKMIANVSNNTQETPMRDLHAAGILSFEGHESDLELWVTYTKDGNTVQKRLGDMPLAEVISVSIVLFAAMPQPSP